MSDFFSSLAMRSLGAATGIRPRVFPRFAEEEGPRGAEATSVFEQGWPEAGEARVVAREAMAGARAAALTERQEWGATEAASVELAKHRGELPATAPDDDGDARFARDGAADAGVRGLPGSRRAGRVSEPGGRASEWGESASGQVDGSLPGELAAGENRRARAVFAGEDAPAGTAAYDAAPADAAGRNVPSRAAAAALEGVRSLPTDSGAPVVFRAVAAAEPGGSPWPAPAGEGRALEGPPIASEGSRPAHALFPLRPAPAGMEVGRRARSQAGARKDVIRPGGAGEPEIHITIGRVEVRASAAPAAAARKGSGPALELAEYLKRRDGSGAA